MKILALILVGFLGKALALPSAKVNDSQIVNSNASAVSFREPKCEFFFEVRNKFRKKVRKFPLKFKFLQIFHFTRSEDFRRTFALAQII